MKSVQKIFKVGLKPLVVMLLTLFSMQVMAADDRFVKANALYTEGQFQEAIEAYNEILKSGVESSELYYNLGNAYYRHGLLPLSIINYERALLLAPHDRDIRYNLELAYSQIADKIEPVGEFFIAKWFSSLRSSSDSDTWAKVSIVLFLLFLSALLLFFFAKSTAFRKLSFTLSVLLILGSAIAFSFSSSQKHKLMNRNRAIIMSPSVTVRSSPDASGTEIFVLHEGTRVKIIQTINHWHEIELQDGSVGWMPVTVLEVI
jgi:tetratricopeptide (TPR) repeat protein